MESVIDIAIDLFLELFGDGFVYLCSAFVPERKLSPVMKKIVSCIAMFISFVLLAVFFLGIIIIVKSKGRDTWGWVCVASGVIYLVTGIALKIAARRNRKREKATAYEDKAD